MRGADDKGIGIAKENVARDREEELRMKLSMRNSQACHQGFQFGIRPKPAEPRLAGLPQTHTGKTVLP